MPARRAMVLRGVWAVLFRQVSSDRSRSLVQRGEQNH